MKGAGSYSLTQLSTGQFFKAELFALTLASGPVLRFTSFDTQLLLAGQAYLTNVIVDRGSITSRIGIEAATLTMTLTPRLDHPTPVAVGGVPLARAAKMGMLDGARLQMWKAFMAKPTGPGELPKVTEGVAWGRWMVADVDGGRQSVSLVLEDDRTLLNVQMPRNVVQRGCVHSLFDAGCTVSKAAFTTSQAVTAAGPNTASSFTTGHSLADGYFDLGVVTFTSGANAGISRTIKRYVNSGGRISVFQPFPSVPSTGDAFTTTPGCDKQQATCSAKFSNLAHFRGYPYVPVPETLYDGGSVSAPAPLIGGQGVPGAGSPWPGNLPQRFTP